MNSVTHKKIDSSLYGRALSLEDNFCTLELKTDERMVADDFGLVHGGAIFAAADYAAMLAVNRPNVVLGSATSQFIKPVVVSDVVHFEAKVVAEQGKKRYVSVEASVTGENVYVGEFVCFDLDKHVLS